MGKGFIFYFFYKGLIIIVYFVDSVWTNKKNLIALFVPSVIAIVWFLSLNFQLSKSGLSIILIVAIIKILHHYVVQFLTLGAYVTHVRLIYKYYIGFGSLREVCALFKEIFRWTILTKVLKILYQFYFTIYN